MVLGNKKSAIMSVLLISGPLIKFAKYYVEPVSTWGQGLVDATER